MLYVANVDEASAATGNAHSARVEAMAKAQGAVAVAISARIEEELTQLPPAERDEYLASLGLAEPGLNRLIRAGYELLGLITFFTAGPKEAKAWTVVKGARAPQAARVIHTDFEKGFIRAETIAYEDYVAHGGEAGRARPASSASKARNMWSRTATSCISASMCKERTVTDLLHYEDFHAGQVFALGTHVLTPKRSSISRANSIRSRSISILRPRRNPARRAGGERLASLRARHAHDRGRALQPRDQPGRARRRRGAMAPAGARGRSLRLEAEVLETRLSSKPDRGFVRFRFSMYRANETGDSERVMMFVSTAMLGRKDGAA